MNILRNIFFCFVLAAHCLSLGSLYNYGSSFGFHIPIVQEYNQPTAEQRREAIFNNPHAQGNLHEVSFADLFLDRRNLVLFQGYNQNGVLHTKTLIRYFYDCCFNKQFPKNSISVFLGQINKNLIFKIKKNIFINNVSFSPTTLDFPFAEILPSDDYSLLIFPFIEAMTDFFCFDYNNPQEFTSENIRQLQQYGCYIVDDREKKYVKGRFNYKNICLLDFIVYLPEN